MMNSITGDRCLGLVGGLGVGAAVHYYQQLAKAYEGRESALHLLMAHADMRRVVRCVETGDRKALAEYLCSLIEQMRAGGAAIAVVPAVTPHICVQELKAISPLPLVDILEAVAREVRAAGYRRVALFGTRFTVQSAFFGALEGVEVVTPRPEEIDAIHAAYFAMASSGEGTAEQHETLTRIAHTLCSRDKVEAILLAGTDLALVFNQNNISFSYVDCAAAHIRAILAELAGRPLI
jgi:aspartate racemase